MLAIASMSELHRQMLRFERSWYRLAGTKVQAIWEMFRMGINAYYKRLAALIELPAALAFDPVLVNRLRRQQRASLRARAWRLA